MEIPTFFPETIYLYKFMKIEKKHVHIVHSMLSREEKRTFLKTVDIVW